MLKALRNLYLRYFGVAESAAVLSTKPAYYYEVYQEQDDHYPSWVFSWYDEKHSKGEALEHPTRELALLARDRWIREMGRRRNIVVPVGGA